MVFSCGAAHAASKAGALVDRSGLSQNDAEGISVSMSVDLPGSSDAISK
jgi:hypothetical protein